MNLANLGQRLLAEMADDSSGDFSPSIYETARVVATSPRLAGHEDRIRYLRKTQNRDGSWSGPGAYSVLPTLSATDGLFAELARTRDAGLAGPVRRGLRALRKDVSPGRGIVLPDTVAVELLVPWLVGSLTGRLAALEANPLPGLDFRDDGGPLESPPGTYPALLAAVRDAVAHGGELPEKLWHSLEMLGPAAENASFVRSGQFGVGCSPAATAAWLGERATADNPDPGVRYLETVQARHGGPVPVAAPLDVFERAWVLTTLTDVGLPVTVPAGLAEDLRAAFGPGGVPGGAGLPTDADDTSTALHALANLHVRQPIEPLWRYREDGHFSTFPGERTPSVTTNAHVLQALSAYPRTEPGVVAATEDLTGWLVEQQLPGGGWTDKWHASPYYATVTCIVALASAGGGTDAARRAVRWVLESQYDDGSWGFWDGTLEETAYAVQILLRADTGHADVAAEQAAARGCAYLIENHDRPCPPLWHDKDLYTPARIVRAEAIAALHLAGTHPRVSARVPWPGTGPAERTA